jgi:glycosyltransferase involved in cell wall biosynthesis
MRIAQISPLYESVPPKSYGGTERIVSYLTEELVRQGHDVTLFASGDSLTRAELKAICPASLRTSKNCKDPLAHHMVMLEKVFQCAPEFDIIHNHVDYLAYSLFRRSNVPTVTTLHLRLDIPDLEYLYQEFDDMPLISISDSQRRPLNNANWQKTVYHGLPPELYKPYYNPAGEYFAFLGRISPEKRVDRAMEIAKRCNTPIKIAAKIEKIERDYYDQEIKHLMEHPLVEFIGEIPQNEKNSFLGNARALLFPIDWPEPFGLVMIEAMACGLPVIAWNNGSVPEIIEEGKNGYIVQSMDEAVAAGEKIDRIDRRVCRKIFENRFSAKRMTKDYLSLYKQMIDSSAGLRFADPFPLNTSKPGSDSSLYKRV